MATLRISRWYPHPPAQVWRALTDPELLARWLMPNDFQPRVGHRFTFRTEPAPGFDGVVHCEVIEIDAPRRMALTWKGGPIDTVLTFGLSADRGGTLLKVEQSGFRGLKAWLVSRILKAGLPTIYGKKLPAVLAAMGSAAPEPGREIDAGCMTHSQSWIRRALSWLQGAGR